MIYTIIWLGGKRKKIGETNELPKSRSMKSILGQGQARLSQFLVGIICDFVNSEIIYYIDAIYFIILTLDLSTKLSKDSISALWWAIVGLTDQWTSKKILESQYTANVFRHGLQNNALRWVAVNCQKFREKNEQGDPTEWRDEAVRPSIWTLYRLQKIILSKEII